LSCEISLDVPALLCFYNGSFERIDGDVDGVGANVVETLKTGATYIKMLDLRAIRDKQRWSTVIEGKFKRGRRGSEVCSKLNTPE
jgi:hypothetical protein